MKGLIHGQRFLIRFDKHLENFIDGFIHVNRSRNQIVYFLNNVKGYQNKVNGLQIHVTLSQIQLYGLSVHVNPLRIHVILFLIQVNGFQDHAILFLIQVILFQIKMIRQQIQMILLPDHTSTK